MFQLKLTAHEAHAGVQISDVTNMDPQLGNAAAETP